MGYFRAAIQIFGLITFNEKLICSSGGRKLQKTKQKETVQKICSYALSTHIYLDVLYGLETKQF